MKSWVSKVSEAISTPGLAYLHISRKLNRFFHTPASTRNQYPEGVDIFNQDWDNLLILDACQYDHLQDCEFDTEFETCITKGSSAREFIIDN